MLSAEYVNMVGRMKIWAWFWNQNHKKMEGGQEKEGSPAFHSTNDNSNEVRRHWDLQERKRMSFIFDIHFHFETNSPLKKMTWHWPAVWSDRWLGCCRSDLVPDHHATHSSMPPAPWGQTPETQENVPSVSAEQLCNSVLFFFRLSWHALHCCFVECIISALSCSCMSPVHSKCASLTDCPGKESCSYSEWPVVGRNS